MIEPQGAPQTLEEALRLGGKVTAPETLEEALRLGGKTADSAASVPVGLTGTASFTESQQRPQQSEPTPKKEPSTIEKILSYAPSGRDVSGILGAMTGAAAGLPTAVTGPGVVVGVGGGGALGYAGGAGLYDIVQQLLSGTPREPTVGKDLATGFVQEAGGKLIDKLAGPIERSAVKSTEKAIGPAGLKETKAIREAAPALASDLPVAATTAGLNEKMAARVTGLTNELESEWSKLAPTRQIPTAPVSLLLRKERMGLYNANGTLVRGAEKMEQELTSMIDYLDQNPALSPQDFRNNRQLWDKFVNFYRPDTIGASSTPERELVYGAAADGFRNIINRTFPEIGRLNEELAAAIPASKVLDRRVLTSANNPMGTFMKKAVPEMIGTALGGAAGAVAGHPEAGALIGGGAALLKQVMNTTAWQTAAVPIKLAIVKLIHQGAGPDVLGALLGQLSQGALKSGETAPLGVTAPNQ